MLEWEECSHELVNAWSVARWVCLLLTMYCLIYALSKAEPGESLSLVIVTQFSPVNL